MQAWLDGEEVENRVAAPEREWRPTTEPRWQWSSVDYRIKPKPREWWACWNKPGEDDWTDVTLFPYPDYDESCVDHWRSRIKVREILE